MRGHNKQNLVMIADDDLFVRKVIRSALEDMAEIVEASDGAEVEAIYRQHTPDVIFLDIHLPNVSGLELVRRLVKQDLGAYVIMLSADSSFNNVKMSKVRGSRGFLTKPFDKKRILHYFNSCPTVSFADEGTAESS